MATALSLCIHQPTMQCMSFEPLSCHHIQRHAANDSPMSSAPVSAVHSGLGGCPSALCRKYGTRCCVMCGPRVSPKRHLAAAETWRLHHIQTHTSKDVSSEHRQHIFGADAVPPALRAPCSYQRCRPRRCYVFAQHSPTARDHVRKLAN